MGRECGSKETKTGSRCRQIVEDWHDHCEAGHYSTPSRPKALTKNRNLKAREEAFEIDDLLSNAQFVALQSHKPSGPPTAKEWDRLVRLAHTSFDDKSVDAAVISLLARPDSSYATFVKRAAGYEHYPTKGMYSSESIADTTGAAPLGKKARSKGGKTAKVSHSEKTLTKAQITKISARLKKLVVTLDMDGTAFDPWACCHKSDQSRGSEKCRHVRHDIIDQVLSIVQGASASLVVLSWRAGGEAATRDWLKSVGIAVDAVFIPGGTEDIRDPSIKSTDYGQVGFKVAIVKSLQALGHEVIASFDDRDIVCEALRKAGVLEVHQAKHLVKVLPHEFMAGYIGAPKPDPSKNNKESKFDERKSWWRLGTGSLLHRHQQQFELDDVSDDDWFGAYPDPELLGSIDDDEDEYLRMVGMDEAMSYDSQFDPFDPSYDPDSPLRRSEIFQPPEF